KDRYNDVRALLIQAEEADPRLPGLREFRLEFDKEYQVLKVAVPEFPEFLSPARACTNTEVRCVEMLFESLVRQSPNALGLSSYRAGLAVGRPRVIHLGREFLLPREVVWTDGEELSANDLRFTRRRMTEGYAAGRPPVWGEMIESINFRGDSTHV